jgi:hypothetical protein
LGKKLSQKSVKDASEQKKRQLENKKAWGEFVQMANALIKLQFLQQLNNQVVNNLFRNIVLHVELSITSRIRDSVISAVNPVDNNQVMMLL